MDEPAAKEAAEQAAKAVAPATREVARAASKIEESSRQVEKSTKAVEKGTDKVVGDTNRQLTLAADRTLLATERTYAAWVRTALSSLAAGVGARALLEGIIPLWLAQLTGSVLVVFAGFCLVAAVWRHLWPAVPPPTTDLRPVPRALLLPLNAFLLLVALAALIGIWAA